MTFRYPSLVELHLHLEGTIYPKEALYLSQKNKIPFSENIFSHNSFEDFLRHFGKAVSLLKEKEDFALILNNHLKRLKKWGVIYAEIRISPSVWEYFGLNSEEIAKFIFSLNFDNCPKFNFIIESVRHWETKFLEKDFLMAVKNREKVKGFGLGGNEILAPIENFKFLFTECKKNRIEFIPHCGEVTSADEVLKAVDFGAKRIGHGVKSVESGSVIKRVREENVHLEICPTSNYALGVIKQNSEHPLKEFYRRGIKFSISTDDPALFKTTLKKELFLTEKTLNFEKDCIFKIQKDAIHASLMNSSEKEEMLRKHFL